MRTDLAQVPGHLRQASPRRPTTLFRTIAQPASSREGLKPLAISHTPSESSHSAIGSAASPDCAEVRPQTSNSTAVKEATSRGAPMNPSSGRTRGTRRDLYSGEPSSRALTAVRRLCPSRKVRSQPDQDFSRSHAPVPRKKPQVGGMSVRTNYFLPWFSPTDAATCVIPAQAACQLLPRRRRWLPFGTREHPRTAQRRPRVDQRGGTEARSDPQPTTASPDGGPVNQSGARMPRRTPTASAQLSALNGASHDSQPETTTLEP